jgi:hypothetical protein
LGGCFKAAKKRQLGVQHGQAGGEFWYGLNKALLIKEHKAPVKHAAPALLTGIFLNARLRVRKAADRHTR